MNFPKNLPPLNRLLHGQRRGKPPFIGDDMKKFCGHQRWKNHRFSPLRFRLDNGHGPCIGWVIGKCKLDQNIAIQANHCLLNISSAKSVCEITGVKTRWPLSDLTCNVECGAVLSVADTNLATGWLP